jgi:PTS system mannose-specific IIA component
MIGIVVVTHGRLAQELVAATEHVVGTMTAVRSVCVGPTDDLDQRRRDVKEAVAAVNGGDGVIVVTDMFGGTPANLAVTMLEKGRVEVLAGANLPMLIKLAEARASMSLADAVDAACEAGQRYIAVAGRGGETGGK